MNMCELERFILSFWKLEVRIARPQEKQQTRTQLLFDCLHGSVCVCSRLRQGLVRTMCGVHIPFLLKTPLHEVYSARSCACSQYGQSHHRHNEKQTRRPAVFNSIKFKTWYWRGALFVRDWKNSRMTSWFRVKRHHQSSNSLTC